MEPNSPQTHERRALSRRLVWTLAIVALASTAAGAYSWSQRNPDADIPANISVNDLGAGDLGSEDAAPDFSVPTLDGAQFSLASHLSQEGTPVLLNLWASWCTPCRAEMPALEAASLRHPGIKIVGVAVQDDNVAAEQFATELGVTYTIGFDTRDEVNALYPSFGLPVTYVISADGIILQPLFGELTESKIDSIIATWFGG